MIEEISKIIKNGVLYRNEYTLYKNRGIEQYQVPKMDIVLNQLGRKLIIMEKTQLKQLEIPKWGTYLRGRWRECFASHLSFKEQQEIWMNDFLWHFMLLGKGKMP